jgi:tRNA(Ile)-lysidine synthase
MIEKVCQYMESQYMIPPGQRILAAVSGGADSMCLLQILLELQKKKQADFTIRVLHVHHGLRESAEGDLQYVQQFCERAGIPFQAVRVDAARYAAENGMSVEEAARHLRYEALEKAAVKWDAEAKTNNLQKQCRIAVAHHIEDQAETVLFHLVRGSRLTGLRGMLPVNGRIIRPLMCCSREEIEDFLKERGIVWREDETNEDVRYARNLLRKQVMPLLLTINEGAKEHIARAAEEVAEAEQYLAGETERALQRCLVRSDVGRKTVQMDAERYPMQMDAGRFLLQNEKIILHIPTLLAEPPLLQRRVVYAAIAEAAGRKKDLHDIHVQAVLHLCRKQGNGQLDVAGGVHVRKVYEN